MDKITIKKDPESPGIGIEFPAVPVEKGNRDRIVVKSLTPDDLGFSANIIGIVAIATGYLKENAAVVLRYNTQEGLDVLREVVAQMREKEELSRDLTTDVRNVLARVSERILRGEAIEYTK